MAISRANPNRERGARPSMKASGSIGASSNIDVRVRLGAVAIESPIVALVDLVQPAPVGPSAAGVVALAHGTPPPLVGTSGGS